VIDPFIESNNRRVFQDYATYMGCVLDVAPISRMSSQRKFASFVIYLYGPGREAQTNQAPEHFWLRDDKNRRLSISEKC